MNLRESKRETGRQKTILAYHGTDRLDFARLRLRKASASQVDIAEEMVKYGRSKHVA